MSSKRKRNKNKKKDEEEAKPPKTNFDAIIRQNLSDFKVSFGNFPPKLTLLTFSLDKSSVAYTKLVINGNKLIKKIDNISSSFASYKNLRDINLTNNNISDFSICKQQF